MCSSDLMDKPAVDRVEGVPPAIAIDQTNPVRFMLFLEFCSFRIGYCGEVAASKSKQNCGIVKCWRQ